MDQWEIGLLAVAGFIAVSALVRLMTWHRDELVARFRRDFQREQEARQAQQNDLKRQPPEQRRAG